MEYMTVLFRTVLAFGTLFVVARLLGKQQLSQLTFYEYITGITMGDIAASIAIDSGRSPLYYMFALVAFAIITFGMGVITEKSRPLRKLIEGEPVVLVHNGKILEHNMAKSGYNMENLMMQLRERDAFDISEVEFAIAETDGYLTVLKKSQNRPVTPADLGIDTKYEGVPSEIIVDGEVIHQNLKQNHLDEAWLIARLNSLGYNNPKEIAYASLDSEGNLYVDDRRDQLDPMTDISD
ncbi:MAG TPA: DUF421 domain-containing protein [Syntrophomonadaceae bacterium]|nr:DUF421 domain-containing protein [Syntrophomonadaceae bacterium]